jgi:hypothetical protein
VAGGFSKIPKSAGLGDAARAAFGIRKWMVGMEIQDSPARIS